MVKLPLKKARGFTLIELMLASALLMTIMYAGYYGYSLYSQKWQKRVDLYWHSTKQGIGLDAINKLFLSASSYVLKNEIGKESVYFDATQKHIKFISNSPILSTGTALVELQIIESDGISQLVYKERNLNQYPLYFLADIDGLEGWSKEVVLLDNLSEISWSFYGWTSFSDALLQAEITESAGKQELRQAYQIHDVGKIRVLPVHIKFYVVQNQHTSQLSIEMPNHTVFSVIANTRSDA